MSLNVGELMVVLGMETGPFSKGVGLAVEGLNRFASAMADTAKKAIMAASDFNETSNVMEVGFGKGAKAAEMWAETTAKSVGRTTQQMREFASVSQAMLSSMVGSAEAAAPLSKGLAQLAVDLGSFWNVADKDAFGALRSAMAGQTEPMMRFGVTMTEANLNAYALANGVKVVTQNMSEGEKTLLRYHFIMDKTKKEQGDAAKTADSFANQLKALGADADEASRKIGTNLIGEASKWLTLIRDIIKEMNKGAEKGFFTGLASDLASAVRHGAEKVLNIAGMNVGENKTVERNPNAAPFDLGAMVDADMAEKQRIADLASIKGKKLTAEESKKAFDEGEAKYYKVLNARARRYEAEADEEKAAEEKLRKFEQNSMLEGQRWIDAENKADADRLERETIKQEKEQDWLKAQYDPLVKQTKGATDMQANGGVNAFRSVLGGDMGGAAIGILQSMGQTVSGAASGVIGTASSLLTTAVSKYFEFAIQAFKGVADGAMQTVKTFMPADTRGAGAIGSGMAMSGAMAGAMAVAGFPILTAMFGPLGMVIAPLVVALSGLGVGMVQLSTQTNSYKQYQEAMSKGVDRVVQALEPAFQQLLPLAGLFIQLSTSVGMILAKTIPGPAVAHQVFEGFRQLATGIAWTLVGFINLRVAVTQLNAGIYKFLNETIFHGKDDNIKRLAGESGGDAQRALDERQALIDNAIFIHGMTEAGASALATSEALDKLTRSTTNMPSGYRVDVAAARAQDANGTRPGDPTNGIAPGNYTGSVPGSGASGGAGQQSQQRRAWDEMVSNLARAAANLANSKDYVNTGNARRPTRYAGRT